MWTPACRHDKRCSKHHRLALKQHLEQTVPLCSRFPPVTGRSKRWMPASVKQPAREKAERRGGASPRSCRSQACMANRKTGTQSAKVGQGARETSTMEAACQACEPNPPFHALALASQVCRFLTDRNQASHLPQLHVVLGGHVDVQQHCIAKGEASVSTAGATPAAVKGRSSNATRGPGCREDAGTAGNLRSACHSPMPCTSISCRRWLGESATAASRCSNRAMISCRYVRERIIADGEWQDVN